MQRTKPRAQHAQRDEAAPRVRARPSVHDAGSAVRERDIERRLVDRVRAAGGVAWKWSSPGRVGVPDRIVQIPGRPAQFVELKRPGAAPTAQQERAHAALARAGGTVWVLDSFEGVDHFLECMAR